MNPPPCHGEVWLVDMGMAAKKQRTKTPSLLASLPSAELSLFNRQRTRRINTRRLRSLLKFLLTDLLQIHDYELTIHFVNATEMAEVNEAYLRHSGSTDVITLDYCEPYCPIAGEIFICIDEALLQSTRFRVPWQVELIRYLAHGILHLQGYDDQRPAARRRMKKKENSLVRALTRQFPPERFINNPEQT